MCVGLYLQKRPASIVCRAVLEMRRVRVRLFGIGNWVNTQLKNCVNTHRTRFYWNRELCAHTIEELCVHTHHKALLE